MNGRTFVTKNLELPQVFRPLHQWDFPIWETRDELNRPHRPGFPKYYVDGTKAVLAKNGAVALNPGVYAESPIISIADINLPKAANIRDSVVTIAATATVAEDAYKDGRLLITGGTGVGHSFPVAGNSGRTGAGNIEVSIGARLPIALDTTSDILLVSSRYRNLRVGTGSGEIAVGIIPVAVPANDYFWIIEEGPTIAIAGEAIAASTRANIDLMPGPSGRLMLRNAAGDEGSQIVASFAQNTNVASAGYMHVIAKFGG